MDPRSPESIASNLLQYPCSTPSSSLQLHEEAHLPISTDASDAAGSPDPASSKPPGQCDIDDTCSSKLARLPGLQQDSKPQQRPYNHPAPLVYAAQNSPTNHHIITISSPLMPWDVAGDVNALDHAVAVPAEFATGSTTTSCQPARKRVGLTEQHQHHQHQQQQQSDGSKPPAPVPAAAHVKQRQHPAAGCVDKENSHNHEELPVAKEPATTQAAAKDLSPSPQKVLLAHAAAAAPSAAAAAAILLVRRPLQQLSTNKQHPQQPAVITIKGSDLLSSTPEKPHIGALSSLVLLKPQQPQPPVKQANAQHPDNPAPTAAVPEAAAPPQTAAAAAASAALVVPAGVSSSHNASSSNGLPQAVPAASAKQQQQAQHLQHAAKMPGEYERASRELLLQEGRLQAQIAHSSSNSSSGGGGQTMLAAACSVGREFRQSAHQQPYGFPPAVHAHAVAGFYGRSSSCTGNSRSGGSTAASAAALRQLQSQHVVTQLVMQRTAAAHTAAAAAAAANLFRQPHSTAGLFKSSYLPASTPAITACSRPYSNSNLHSANASSSAGEPCNRAIAHSQQVISSTTNRPQTSSNSDGDGATTAAEHHEIQARFVQRMRETAPRDAEPAAAAAADDVAQLTNRPRNSTPAAAAHPGYAVHTAAPFVSGAATAAASCHSREGAAAAYLGRQQGYIRQQSEQAVLHGAGNMPSGHISTDGAVAAAGGGADGGFAPPARMQLQGGASSYYPVAVRAGAVFAGHATTFVAHSHHGGIPHSAAPDHSSSRSSSNGGEAIGSTSSGGTSCSGGGSSGQQGGVKPTLIGQWSLQKQQMMSSRRRTSTSTSSILDPFTATVMQHSCAASSSSSCNPAEAASSTAAAACTAAGGTGNSNGNAYSAADAAGGSSTGGEGVRAAHHSNAAAAAAALKLRPAHQGPPAAVLGHSGHGRPAAATASTQCFMDSMDWQQWTLAAGAMLHTAPELLRGGARGPAGARPQHCRLDGSAMPQFLQQHVAAGRGPGGSMHQGQHKQGQHQQVCDDDVVQQDHTYRRLREASAYALRDERAAAAAAAAGGEWGVVNWQQQNQQLVTSSGNVHAFSRHVPIAAHAEAAALTLTLEQQQRAVGTAAAGAGNRSDLQQQQQHHIAVPTTAVGAAAAASCESRVGHHHHHQQQQQQRYSHYPASIAAACQLLDRGLHAQVGAADDGIAASLMRVGGTAAAAVDSRKVYHVADMLQQRPQQHQRVAPHHNAAAGMQCAAHRALASQTGTQGLHSTELDIMQQHQQPAAYRHVANTLRAAAAAGSKEGVAVAPADAACAAGGGHQQVAQAVQRAGQSQQRMPTSVGQMFASHQPAQDADAAAGNSAAAAAVRGHAAALKDKSAADGAQQSSSSGTSTWCGQLAATVGVQYTQQQQQQQDSPDSSASMYLTASPSSHTAHSAGHSHAAATGSPSISSVRSEPVSAHNSFVSPSSGSSDAGSFEDTSESALSYRLPVHLSLRSPFVGVAPGDVDYVKVAVKYQGLPWCGDWRFVRAERHKSERSRMGARRKLVWAKKKKQQQQEHREGEQQGLYGLE